MHVQEFSLDQASLYVTYSFLKLLKSDFGRM
jgi:hypothetical protein